MRHRPSGIRICRALASAFLLAVSAQSHGDLLDASWSEIKTQPTSRDSSTYAGTQTDRTLAGWSGNGGPPSTNANDSVIFSGKSGAGLRAGPSPRLQTILSPRPAVTVGAAGKQSAAAPSPSPTAQALAAGVAGQAPVLTASREGSNIRLSWQGIANGQYEVWSSTQVEGPYQRLGAIPAASDGELTAVVQTNSTAAYFQLRLKNP